MQRNTTGWIVTGVGAYLGGNIGAGVAGFGIAHVVLGVLDNFRPTIRH